MEVRLLVRVVSTPSLLKLSMSLPTVFRLQPKYSASSTSEAATSPTSKAIPIPLMLQTVFVRTALVISLCRHLCLWTENLPSKIKSHCSSERMVQ